MKLSIAQALGTILNIQVAPVQNHQLATVEQWFVIRDPSGNQMLDIGLGKVEGEGAITLDQAVWKAAERTSFSQECHFAVFPIGSNREDYYMSIERELLRQEAGPEFEGKKMWQMLPQGDPRPLVETIMMQLRDCAVNVVHPVLFQQALLRVGCLVVSCMQWVSDWIGRLNIRNAALQANRPEAPKIVELKRGASEAAAVHQSEPVPALFGADGLRVVPAPEKEGDDDAEVNAKDEDEELDKDKVAEDAQEENN